MLCRKIDKRQAAGNSRGAAFFRGKKVVAGNLMRLEKTIRMHDSKSTNPSEQNQKATPKPDAETLHTTDPQENMEGPVSSTMHKTGKAFDTDKSKEEADREHDSAM